MTDERPLAFVVQRYGPDIVGGSEALVSHSGRIAVCLHKPVEVLTSCARDYMTWRNEHKPGDYTLNGVRIRRFPVDFERDHRFDEAMSTILGGMPLGAYHQHRALMRALIGRSSAEQQLACLKLEGPYSTPLLNYLETHHEDYSRIVFFTYLYPTTYFGSQRVPASKMVLIPTAHDEAPIFFPIFRQMFERFPAFIFLSPEERAFVERTFAVHRCAQGNHRYAGRAARACPTRPASERSTTSISRSCSMRGESIHQRGAISFLATTGPRDAICRCRWS